MTSNDRGLYTLLPVPPGVYEIRTDLAGLRPHVRRDQALSVGTTINIDVVLEVGGLTDAVVVLSAAPALETSKHTLTRLVAREEIDTLPVGGRRSLPVTAELAWCFRFRPGSSSSICGCRS